MALQRAVGAGLEPLPRVPFGASSANPAIAAGVDVEAVMELSAHVRKVSRFEDLLLRVTDTDQRQQINRLLTEEEANAVPRRLGSRPG